MKNKLKIYSNNQFVYGHPGIIIEFDGEIPQENIDIYDDELEDAKEIIRNIGNKKQVDNIKKRIERRRNKNK